MEKRRRKAPARWDDYVGLPQRRKRKKYVEDDGKGLLTQSIEQTELLPVPVAIDLTAVAIDTCDDLPAEFSQPDEHDPPPVDVLYKSSDEPSHLPAGICEPTGSHSSLNTVLFDNMPLILPRTEQTELLPMVFDVTAVAMDTCDDLPADFSQPDEPDPPPIDTSSDEPSDLSAGISEPTGSCNSLNTVLFDNMPPRLPRTEQTELLPMVFDVMAVAMDTCDDLPADFSQPDEPHPPPIDTSSDEPSDLSAGISEPTGSCNSLNTVLFDNMPPRLPTEQTELLPMVFDVTAVAMDTCDDLPADFSQPDEPDPLPLATDVLVISSDEPCDLSAESHDQLAMLLSDIASLSLSAEKTESPAAVIGAVISVINEHDSMLADYRQPDHPDPLPVAADVLVTLTDGHNRSAVLSQPFLPAVTVSEQHSVQDCISPSTEYDIATNSNLADGVYSVIVDNEAVLVTVSHTDPGKEVPMSPGCNVDSCVQLHSDLLLLDSQVCEDHVISSSASGGQNVEATSSLECAHDTEKGGTTILSRKRRRRPHMWKKTLSKVKRQSGQQYITARGKVMPGRSYETRSSCSSCRFKCHENIPASSRSLLHENFWKMTDDAKFAYYEQTTHRFVKERTRTGQTSSRRTYSYQYFFTVNNEKVRVCKAFYLSTLDISQRRVSYYHETVRIPATGMARPDQRGKHCKKVIPEAEREAVRTHIKSFPLVSSHYCRTSSNKQYLDSRLNIAKMYELYAEECQSKNNTPVKCKVYRDIFNTEFNIAFHTPKKDRCDMCEQFVVASANNLMTPELSLSHSMHTAEKLATKQERDSDRQCSRGVLCFDLQNVIVVPSANVSNMFYKRKLNVYNLTAHLSIKKKGYCSVWHEGLSGRGGNDIASALVAILKKVIAEFPQLTELVLWADSCIPQNRNSLMSLAIIHFLSNQTTLTAITQKFCQPGHSSIQEVDNLHSQIDRCLQVSEIYSPLGVIRLLLSVNRKNPLHVIQMTADQFVDYKAAAKQYNFTKVPYMRVKAIAYKKSELCHVQLKTSFDTSIEQFVAVPVTNSCCLHLTTVSSGCQEQEHHTPRIGRAARNTNWLSAEKKKDIESMYPFMPSVDKQFMETVMKTRQPSSHDKGEVPSSLTTDVPSAAAGTTELRVRRKSVETKKPTRRRGCQKSPTVTHVKTGTTSQRSRKRAQGAAREVVQSKRKRLC